MITLIEALNYRSLRYVRQPLGPFHVLIGPNASGKSMFLDVVAFLGRLVSDGVEAAVTERTENFVDLLWKGEGERFELVIEAALPAYIKNSLGSTTLEAIRYEVAIGPATGVMTDELVIGHEHVYLKPATDPEQDVRTSFPGRVESPVTLSYGAKAGWQTVVSKNRDGDANFVTEARPKKRAWTGSFKLGPQKSALGSLPPDDSQFPASLWLRELLAVGVRSFALNSAATRLASPPNQQRRFRTDGSNLPWIVHALRHDVATVQDWIAHLRTALPDLSHIESVLRNDDRHRYLVLEYDNGLRVPSWMASDGTLRLLALTLPAYLPDFQGIYLIEEPENGIHPKAIDTVFQSLSSVYDAQLLLASHSPVILSCASADTILCFAKNEDGATDIVTGANHPRLQEWKGETNLGQLFAAGVLG